MHKFIVSLTSEDFALIDDAKLECFIVEGTQTQASKLVETIKKNGKIVLIAGENACEVCNKYQADGVLIDLSKSEHCVKDVDFARKQIGDKVLGIISRNRRHESMLISECEPDFVVFKAWNQGLEQVKELVSWYNEMFLIQSAVILQEPIEKINDFDCDIIIGSTMDYKKFKDQ